MITTWPLPAAGAFSFSSLFYVLLLVHWSDSLDSRLADMKCVAVVRGCSFSAAAAILRAAAAAGHGFLFDAMHAIACDHMLELLFACELEDNFHMNFFTYPTV